MKLGSLGSLSTLQNHISIDSSLSGALLDSLVTKVQRRLLAENVLKGLLGEVLLSAQLNPVSIALLVAMLALEGGGIARDHMGVSVRNELQVSDRHDVGKLRNLLDIRADERGASRAENFVVEGRLHLISLLVTIRKYAYGSRKSKSGNKNKQSTREHTSFIMGFVFDCDPAKPRSIPPCMTHLGDIGYLFEWLLRIL